MRAICTRQRHCLLYLPSSAFDALPNCTRNAPCPTDANKSLRLDWPDHTSVEIYFWAKGERRSQVNVMHRQLTDPAQE